MTRDLRWAVLVGGFTGDGSAEHQLFAVDNGRGDQRVPVFTSQAAAEQYVLQRHIGEHCLIAEVIVSATPATEMRYTRTGSRIMASNCT